MFRRRFERRFEGPEGERWEGPHGWHHGHHRPWPHHRHGPHFFDGLAQRRFARRGGPFGPPGPFGPGRPFGPGGPFGDGGGGFRGGKRFFGRGDLKYALLELLQERPMHGYEMMKALQERSGGRYTASPGSIYPTVQMLEDRGFVTVNPSEGKKIYSITDDGRAFLAAGSAEDHGEHGGRGFWPGRNEEWTEAAALWQELRACRPLLMSALQSARHDPEKFRRLKKLVERIRQELSEIAGTTSRFDA